MIYGAGLLVLLGIAVVPDGPLYLTIYLAIEFIHDPHRDARHRSGHPLKL